MNLAYSKSRNAKRPNCDRSDDGLTIVLFPEQQSSYWGNDTLTPQQIAYAASDVYHLHKLRDILDMRLEKEGRLTLCYATMKALPVRAWLDIEGWADKDIFAHSA